MKRIPLALAIIIIALSLTSCPLLADPWGKDSDLLETPKKIEENHTLSFWLAKKVIRFHQEWLSPTDGPRSHFCPSSSSYMLLAIKKHGFLCGFGLGCDRLLRENDEKWLYPVITFPDGNRLKWDPVP